MHRPDQVVVRVAVGLALAGALALDGSVTARAQAAFESPDRERDADAQCIEPAVATEAATCDAPTTCEEPLVATEATPPSCDTRRLDWGMSAELVCEDAAAVEITGADAMCVEG
jgi:hypothetical protein